MQDILLELIYDNPFNSRRFYDDSEIVALADSISRVGILNPIKVRAKNSIFEIVYGHRRVRAAKLLNWKSIQAIVGEFSDDQLVSFSLIENLERKDLSDYEKALSFERMRKDFGKSNEEIGRIVGLSKGHVSNYLSMIRMIDQNRLTQNPDLVKMLHAISEHHARYLNRIEEPGEREKALRMVVSENLSVRDLQRMIQRLRSWFKPDDETSPRNQWDQQSSAVDLMEIQNALSSKFMLPSEGNFQKFTDFHDFHDDFSIYSAFSPCQMIEGFEALEKEKNWFYSVAPHFSFKIRDVRIRFFEDTALATLYVDYLKMLKDRASRKVKVLRGSVLFAKHEGAWKIVHEHWSNLEQ